MNITSMEVIRPGVVAVGVLPGEKIELTYGDTLKVNVSFDYRGLGETVTLFGAIGRSGFPGEELEDEGSFIKRLTGEQSIDLPPSLEFTPVAASVDIPITTEISPGTNYDLYVKLVEYRKEAGMPKVDDIIDIPPEYELIEETIYHFAYIYEGDADLTTFTFKTDPFTSVDWIAGRLASHVENEVRKDGGRVMEMRVYVDKTPLLWTDWKIEVVGIPPATVGVGVGVGIAWWVGVLIACLALIALILVTYHFVIKPLTRSRTPGLEDVKPAWGKEALILDIQDAEEYWERTPTPVETLEGMSEGELRDSLDQIAEEEVPPEAEFPWGLLVIGGVAVLGVGAAAIALTARRE